MGTLVRKDAQLKCAENGLILEYTEYMPSSNCYDGLQYIGRKSKIYEYENATNAVEDLVSIYNEENKTNIIVAITLASKKEENAIKGGC